jgi:DNA-binding Xre family transcriptional regulator
MTIFAKFKDFKIMLRKKRGTLTPHQNSIVLHLKPILVARNILHPSAFLIKIGINNTTATKMLKGEAVQINFRQLTLLCTHLNCTPNDLLALRQLDLPIHHQLNQLQKHDETLQNTHTLFENKSLQEIKNLLKPS